MSPLYLGQRRPAYAALLSELLLATRERFPVLPDPPRQGLRPRRHLRVERTRSAVPAISCPARALLRKTQVALDSSAHAHTLPFGAPAPPSPELYNRHLCESLSSLVSCQHPRASVRRLYA